MGTLETSPSLGGPPAAPPWAAVASLPIWQALHTALGNSTDSAGGIPARNINGVWFPAIPHGKLTTIIPVVFEVTTQGPPAQQRALEESTVLLFFFLAGVIWMIPWLFANSRYCCKCFSRRLGSYACFGLIVNLTLLSIVVATQPDVSFNDLFFKMISVTELVTDKLQEVLMQIGAVFGIVIAYSFRNKLTDLLGFDSALLKVEMRDCLTCFSMKRFQTIEISMLSASDLQIGFIPTRSLYVRVVCGVNEPLHSRPRDGCTTSLNLRERFQLNFDPLDTSQKLSIVIKEQEVVGAAVAQLAPVGGMIVGALGGLTTPLGPQVGAVVGGLTGVGTANSLGPEVARIDMSADSVNKLLLRSSKTKTDLPRSLATGPSVPWREDHFVKVDLVPQGYMWLRISDVELDV